MRFLTPHSLCQPLPSSSAIAQGLLQCLLEIPSGESEGGRGPLRGSQEEQVMAWGAAKWPEDLNKGKLWTRLRKRD